jgi:DNA adenine methylase
VTLPAVKQRVAAAQPERDTARGQRPFLKWAGNKYRVLEKIHPLLPRGKRLIEPFAGSGALFLNSDFQRYLLMDCNNDLISLYNILKQDGAGFIDYCAQYFTPATNREERYYKLRAQFNNSDDPYLRAALFIYLNRHGYNGLCRYNADGGFNVPFGQYKKPRMPAREMLGFHHKARHASFKLGDFAQTLKSARPGDVVYCDPPYAPLSASANFTSYHSSEFGLDAQARLAQLAGQTAQRGIPVLISNHDTPYTRELYQQADIIVNFQVQRSISCNGQQRRSAGELLALYKGKSG